MLKRIIQKHNEDIHCPVVEADKTVSSIVEPAQTIITRNYRPKNVDKQPGDIFDRARGIYFRARKISRNRSASIF